MTIEGRAYTIGVRLTLLSGSKPRPLGTEYSQNLSVFEHHSPRIGDYIISDFLSSVVEHKPELPNDCLECPQPVQSFHEAVAPVLIIKWSQVIGFL